MTEAEVRGLCLKSREIFLSQPILLELEAPLKICGEWVLGSFKEEDDHSRLRQDPGRRSFSSVSARVLKHFKLESW